MKRRHNFWVWLAGVLTLASRLSVPAALDVAQVVNATFRITDKSVSSTGFLVRPPADSALPSNTVFLVTCAHALENIQGNEATLVLRSRTHDTFVRLDTALRIRSSSGPLWQRHPTADIAAIRFDPPPAAVWEAVAFEQLASENDFRARVKLGVTAWIYTFPAQFEANPAGFPVLRRGSVASLPLPPLESNPTFLVDFTTFGGDSGGPVLVAENAGEKALVTGIVIGMQRQTDRYTLPFEDRTIHYPLGLGIVVHSDFVRQTIRAATQR